MSNKKKYWKNLSELSSEKVTGINDIESANIDAVSQPQRPVVGEAVSSPAALSETHQSTVQCAVRNTVRRRAAVSPCGAPCGMPCGAVLLCGTPCGAVLLCCRVARAVRRRVAPCGATCRADSAVRRRAALRAVRRRAALCGSIKAAGPGG